MISMPVKSREIAQFVEAFMKRGLIAAVCLVLFVSRLAGAAGFESLEAQVKEYRIPNGLTFLVLERHDAPVFSYVTYVDAGSVDDLPGTTGIAHMFEHMAFKGTPTVGTKDFAVEQEAMKNVDKAVAALNAELDKRQAADSTRIAALTAAVKDAEKKAQEYVVSNDFSKILEENGVVDLNAGTFTDWTQYSFSLPSNRLELWARLEGDRLTQPVMREFYTERDVVYEERRFDESSPVGRLFSAWLAASFDDHPYGKDVIGYASDLKRITREDAMNFRRKYYVAPNITIALVGDVRFDDVKRLADTYFSNVPGGDDPPPLRTVEPRHDSEVRVIHEEDAQPVVLIGYHIPGGGDPDWFAADILSDVVGSGRTSRLYKRLVKEDKIAAQTGASAGFIGDKYPTLLFVQAVVAKDAAPESVEAAIYQELDRVSSAGPTADELKKIKTRAQASVIREMRSNSGLAEELATYEEKWGDWHKLFRYLKELDKVTPADVQRVSKETFRPGNRVVGILRHPRMAAAQGGSK
jgi:predicted Zn-dependent peptidase